MTKRFVLQDHLDKLSERGMEITAPDGQVFKISAPELWPDEVNEAFGLNSQAVALMGEERYAEFVKAGGTARLLNAFLEEFLDGKTVGERSASSRS